MRGGLTGLFPAVAPGEEAGQQQTDSLAGQRGQPDTRFPCEHRQKNQTGQRQDTGSAHRDRQ